MEATAAVTSFEGVGDTAADVREDDPNPNEPFGKNKQ